MNFFQKFYLSALVGFLFTLALASNGQAQNLNFKQKDFLPTQEYMPGELIIKFKEGLKDRDQDQIFSRMGVDKISKNARTASHRVKIRGRKKIKDAIDQCRQDPNIEYAEPNYIVYAHAVPNDPFFSYQWDLDNPVSGGVNMEEAWNISSSHEQIVVAVIDTGVAYEDYTKVVNSFRTEKYYRAPDLAQTKFVPGYDFVENDNHPNDDHGHGTHVTGTIAQSTNNNYGVAGIAYHTSIMPIKVLKKDGTGSSFDLADGITWASDHGAKVINLSLGSPFSSTTIRNACEYAYAHGTTLVCSAGNDDTDKVGYPARYDPCCIAVGATRLDETRSYYSNYGEGLDIVAPGGDLNVDQNSDGFGDGILQETFDPVDRSDFHFWFYQGTSMSAPHVSGIAALLLSAGVASTPQEVRHVLQSTAKDLGAPGYDSEYGWGLVDAAAALNNNSGTPPPVPVNRIPVANPGGPYTGVEDQSIAFNGSGSNDADHDPLTYAWDFGDGLNGSGVSPTHIYVNPGVYTVSLMVSDGKSNSTPVTTTANIQAANVAPTAKPGGPYTGTVGSAINFNGSGSFDSNGSIVSYSWNFGDGTSANTVNPTHSYSLSGTFNVSLTVTDNNNATHTASTTAQITQPALPGTPVEVFYDSFEVSEWNGLWSEDAQNDWERTTLRSTQGRYSANIDGDTVDGALSSVSINLSGKTNATISFNWLIKLWLDVGEYIAFDISTDNGATWQEKGRLRGDVDQEDVWRAVSLNVTNISSLKLRFRGLMNSSIEDANVDQVKVKAW